MAGEALGAAILLVGFERFDQGEPVALLLQNGFALIDGSLIEGILRFLIRVTCIPEDGKANRAVTKLLAKALGLPPSRLTLLRGQTGRDKTFRVE